MKPKVTGELELVSRIVKAMEPTWSRWCFNEATCEIPASRCAPRAPARCWAGRRCSRSMKDWSEPSPGTGSFWHDGKRRATRQRILDMVTEYTHELSRAEVFRRLRSGAGFRQGF